MNALFTYTTDKHQDFAYDYNSNATGAFSSVDYFETVVSTRIISQVSSILEKHAAIMLSAPLFSPKLSHNIHRGVNVLDSSGTIVQLPHDLTFPWCRFISRVSPMPAHLKRYAIDRVFRVNPAGGQPRSVLECDFDIVTRSDTDHHGFVPDAEVVSTLCQIIDQFPSNLGKSSEFDLIINHCDVLDAILDFSGAPKDEESRSIVYRILEQERASLNTRSTMLQRLGLDRAISDKLVLFDFGGKSTMDFSTAVARLQTLLKDSSAASALISKPIKQMEILVRNLKLMGTRCKIVFSPLLSYHMDYYKGSLVFQLGKREKQKIGKKKLHFSYYHYSPAFSAKILLLREEGMILLWHQ